MSNLKQLAKRMGRLETLIYPESFQNGSEDFLSDLREYSDHLAYIHQVDGKDVGYLFAYREGNEIYVSDIAVLPNYRGHTVSEALVREFLTWTRHGDIIHAECRTFSVGLAKRYSDYLEVVSEESFEDDRGETMFDVVYRRI